ncbi:MAG: hypothetical protein A2Y88_05140 [Chloroflexi bacterium RBG_13_48_10]|nr:MAG: hypothetical protein A2Y88_05140 [Chloroflexi bacterium RBG_13_48_10]
MKLLSIVMISLILVTTACSSLLSGGEELTIPSQWKLMSFSRAGDEITVVEGSTVTLEFGADGQLGGTGGCNGFGALYEVKNDMLIIKEIVSTLMACMDDGIMEQETQYFSALQSATKYEISGDHLTIFFGEAEDTLNFVKQ